MRPAAAARPLQPVGRPITARWRSLPPTRNLPRAGRCPVTITAPWTTIGGVRPRVIRRRADPASVQARATTPGRNATREGRAAGLSFRPRWRASAPSCQASAAPRCCLIRSAAE